MDSLEISTITILHTLSTLNKNELTVLGQIAQSSLSSRSDKIDLPKAGESIFYDDQLQVLLKKFNVQCINDLKAILTEINFLSIFRNS